ncbi:MULTISPECIES: 2TM domain-containing protein [unclassified Chryseobacterium]|uniref:2TM domain-containing protein n=1 Tax=unclassified Chryseobacterium TaxID=2593645 RepID=UPI000D70E2B4|nr:MULTISPECIES: 2TM domain-containing protein [unclassified Chryseobacterium]PWW28563.1 2TM domain-containing protein [Chryseobacterium sp. AG844]
MEILPDKETIAYRKASRRVKDLKEFYGNLTSYCIIIPFLAILNIVTAHGYLWFLWPALGWGVGIAFHAISVFGIGKSWEERKIRELMEKDEKQKIKTL